jgi:small subunit ribosomal protein S15
MHTRKRGQAKSRKAFNKPAPSWVKLSKEEIVALVVKLSKEGKRESDIGQTLRDQYGVPSVKALVGRTVSQILKGEKMEPKYPSDLVDLIRKAVQMRKHLAANKRDTSNNHSLELVESKINRLVRYYRGKKLPAKWSYDPAQAALLVK